VSILNLTQHGATPQQLEAGVVEPSDKTLVCEMLTFDDFPTEEKIRQRAYDLAEYAWMEGPCKAMISGPPYLMSILEAELIAHNIQPVYAFSMRESVEEAQPDGSVVKKTVLRHVGFVELDTF
jgi:hypothetical protein